MCEIKFENLIKRYGDNKAQLDEIKKLTDADNKLIKERFERLGTTEQVGGGYVAKLSTSKSESFNEVKLIEILKSNADRMNLQGIIKTKEYVDMDALENAIYNGLLDPCLLVPAKETKTITKLLIKKEK